jgi:signal transduction histidine kinase/PAS domain-containing protein
MRFLEPRGNGRADRQAEPPSGKHYRALRLRLLLRSCPRLCGEFAIVVGTAALVAWWFDRSQLTSIAAGFPPVMPNSALMAVLEGTALVLLAPIAAGRRRALTGTLCAGVAGAIAGLTLSEWLFGVDLGIDRILLTSREMSVREYAGRPSSEVATAFAAVAVALLTINHKTSRGLRPAEILAFGSGLISLVALLGYLFKIAALYGPAPLLPYIGMSILTAVVVLALSIGIMTARINVGVFSILMAQDSGGIVARQLMASLLVFAPIVCALAFATRLGALSAPLAAALIVLLAGVGGGGLILRVSRHLSQLDAERQQAEEQLRLSQERLELALEGANLATWDWDVRTGKVIVNRRWPDMGVVGPNDLSLNADHWISTVHPDDWPLLEQRLSDHFEGRVAAFESEHRVQTKSRGWIWVVARGKVFDRDEHGRPLRMAGTALDITGRKKLDDERVLLADVATILSSSLEHERTLTDVAQLVSQNLAEYCLVDLVEEIGEPRWLKAVGRDPSKAWICDALMQFPPDRARPHLTQSAFQTKGPVLIDAATREMIASWSQNDLHRRALEAMDIRSVVAVPLLAHDRLLGAIALVRSNASQPYTVDDLRVAGALAERAAAAIESGRLYRAARQAIGARDRVMGIVAHDLRNPLAAILLQASVLGRRGTGPDRRSRQPVELIERSARRMSRLIRDLLDMASIEAGTLAVECDRVAVDHLVADSATAQKPLASAASLELRLDVAKDLPEVWGDRERLNQVFENLIGNAVKFTKPGGRVTLGAAEKDNSVMLWVSDTGAGIAAEHLPHVFERFWQAHRDSKRSGGAGLGLPIVKGIVEAHRGHIWVESAAGRGTTFFFTIPIATATQTAPALRDTRRRSA